MRRGTLVALVFGLAALLAASFSPSASAAPVWVFFRDHGALSRPGPARERALAEVAARVTPRALARRAKVGDALDDRDLPPDPAYIAAVAARGGSIRTTSNGLNAISVDALAESLPGIAALPFVSDVRPVAQGALDGSRDVTPADLPDLQDPGPSFLQLDMLHVPEVHAMGDHGEGVLICVLDSGFQLDHQSLRHLEIRGQRDFVNQDDDPSYDPRTDLPMQANHGTAVLSVLAGYMPGVLIGPAYRSEFLLGKTERVSSELPIEEDYWIAGVEWAEAEGADILTSSLTYHAWYAARDLDGRTSPATRAANLALERGLLILNSSGNEGAKGIGAPADAPGAITVGAVNGIGVLTGFSSVGPTYDQRVKPDVVALGSQVYAALARTWDTYIRMTGTSFSTPLVAGCAALVLSKHPDWTPEEVRDAIAMSADRADRPDNQYGWGIVNARDAVLYPLIEGRVTDSITREPLGGATVAIAMGNRREAVETDSTGAYVLPNLPRGNYTLTITKPGYEDATAGPFEVPPNLGDVNVSLRYRGK